MPYGQLMPWENKQINAQAAIANALRKNTTPPISYSDTGGAAQGITQNWGYDPTSGNASLNTITKDMRNASNYGQLPYGGSTKNSDETISGKLWTDDYFTPERYQDLISSGRINNRDMLNVGSLTPEQKTAMGLEHTPDAYQVEFTDPTKPFWGAQASEKGGKYAGYGKLAASIAAMLTAGAAIGAMGGGAAAGAAGGAGAGGGGGAGAAAGGLGYTGGGAGAAGASALGPGAGAVGGGAGAAAGGMGYTGGGAGSMGAEALGPGSMGYTGGGAGSMGADALGSGGGGSSSIMDTVKDYAINKLKSPSTYTDLLKTFSKGQQGAGNNYLSAALRGGNVAPMRSLQGGFAGGQWFDPNR